jgi:hypothetical protein
MDPLAERADALAGGGLIRALAMAAVRRLGPGCEVSA